MVTFLSIYSVLFIIELIDYDYNVARLTYLQNQKTMSCAIMVTNISAKIFFHRLIQDFSTNSSCKNRP
jgi:hypothetical protein